MKIELKKGEELVIVAKGSSYSGGSYSFIITVDSYDDLLVERFNVITKVRRVLS